MITVKSFRLLQTNTRTKVRIMKKRKEPIYTGLMTQDTCEYDLLEWFDNPNNLWPENLNEKNYFRTALSKCSLAVQNKILAEVEKRKLEL